jgi:hypothetical protein
MKLINNRWVDANKNSWSADIETEESSTLKSKSLINCSGCSSCSRCSDCYGCSGCFDCYSCSGCFDCYSCSGCSSCYSCSRCSDCSDCSGCYGCYRCSGCSEYKNNPQRYITPFIGSRNSQTSIYWTNKDDVQIICGCWRGNIKEFEDRVRDVHAKTEYLSPYLEQIEIFKMLVK